MDLVFPAIHGKFGEDGRIQKFLEKHSISFVGSPSRACETCFDKFEEREELKRAGFTSLPTLLITKKNLALSHVKDFFKKEKILRAVVKPAIGGSSIGVYSVTSPEEALTKAKELISVKKHTRVVIEPFCEGIEFTSIILENTFGLPVCLLPVEIEADYRKNQIFDYRKKYLPSRQVTYHCPARFPDSIINTISTQAETLFHYFGMKDFARFDGWYLNDGKIVFTDFNPISGMEQNSFLFLQAARVGMTHRDILRYIIRRATKRYGIDWREKENAQIKKSKKVRVLFGGNTAERQVSLMSGTNVWLKLRNSKTCSPEPYLRDQKEQLWSLPYGFALKHTVEEIRENCLKAKENELRLKPL